MTKKQRLKLISDFQDRYKTMSNEDLEWERFLGGHYYGTGIEKEDEYSNNYSCIQYDCACIELIKRGLYELGQFDGNIYEHINGEYDYHKAIGGK